MNDIIWQQGLRQLAEELPSTRFNTWVRPLIAEPIGENAIYLRTPNSVFCDWVKNNYHDIIVEALCKQNNGIEVRVFFGVGAAPRQLREQLPPSPGSGQGAPPNGDADPLQQQPQTPNGVELTPMRRQLKLDGNYIFDNFVSGESNEIARSYAEQVAERYGDARHNPLVIYGGVGLGKTHLMHAVGNCALARTPSVRVVLCRAEDFVNDMLKSIRFHAMDAFHYYYRSADILLIDDVQFFAGKERSQREVFHAIEHLQHNGGQMVITCDRYPSEIPELDARLRSRFIAGLTAVVEPPDLETRTAILILKAEQEGYHLPEDAALYIAQHYRSNVRELQGGLNGVIARARFARREINLELTRQALSEIVNIRTRGPSLEEIKKRVADYYQIRVPALDSPQRTRSVARPRQLAMALVRELTSLSLVEIGRGFGGRDHTTVLHATRIIEKLRRHDETLANDHRNLVRILSN